MSGSDSSVTRSRQSDHGGDGDCRIEFETTLASPDPNVVIDIRPGDILDIVSIEVPIRGVIAREIGGRDVGAVTRGILDLRRCIAQGRHYEADVLRVDGGSVTVKVRPL